MELLQVGQWQHLSLPPLQLESCACQSEPSAKGWSSGRHLELPLPWFRPGIPAVARVVVVPPVPAVTVVVAAIPLVFVEVGFNIAALLARQ